jgi:hypothetical protein
VRLAQPVGQHDGARALIEGALLVNRALSARAVRPRPCFQTADAFVRSLQAAALP